MSDFRMPSGWYEPPAEHDCDVDGCDGDQCTEDALDAHEANLERRAESDRDEAL